MYQSGLESSPVLLLLHGGGHSALSWAVFSVSVDYGFVVVLLCMSTIWCICFDYKSSCCVIIFMLCLIVCQGNNHA